MHIDRPIAIALTIFVIILLMFFLVIPEYRTFTDLRVELGQKRAEYAAEFDYYNAINEVYINLQNRPDDVKKVDDALPENSDIGEIVYYLQKTIKDNGLVSKNLFLSKTTASTSGPVSTSAKKSEKTGVKDIIFSINLLGNYSSLENFIISLERSARIFEVTSISFDSSAVPPYSFNLQVKTHSY